MDTFFTLLKKSLMVSILMMFAFVATYIPQNWNQVQLAYAGGATGGATEPTQIINRLQLYAINAINTATKAFSKITSWATQNLWKKEFVLDGIAWALAKRLLSHMLSSTVDWINSGFKGRPMFVQDIKGFLREAADQAVGEYIQRLGSIGSFLCDPFKLDIQIAISMQYQRSRVDQPAPTCTLTDVITNFEDFTSGSLGSFNQSGWKGWFDITSAPTVYTPYGSLLAAQAGAEVRILNAKGKETTQLNWGGGFLSSQVCETVHGSDTTTEQCFITTPGKAIQEALSFNLDSGRQSLVAADEFNEVIIALLGQLANKAFQGASGLLGLSSGTGYTYTDPGWTTGDLRTDADIGVGDVIPSAEDIRADMIASRQNESRLINFIAFWRPRLEDIRDDITNTGARRESARQALRNMDRIEPIAVSNRDTLTGLISEIGTDNPDVASIYVRFTSLNLHSEEEVFALRDGWRNI